MIRLFVKAEERHGGEKVFALSLRSSCQVTSDLLLWHFDIECDAEKLRKWFSSESL